MASVMRTKSKASKPSRALCPSPHDQSTALSFSRPPDCDGNCLNDADGDGTATKMNSRLPDETACNYDSTATEDDASCEFTSWQVPEAPLATTTRQRPSTMAATYPEADNLDCEGDCLNDADLDGICDENEIAARQDDTACNYSAEATDAKRNASSRTTTPTRKPP